jgi:predicted transglutaminase-like cysteine proteinase
MSRRSNLRQSTLATASGALLVSMAVAPAHAAVTAVPALALAAVQMRACGSALSPIGGSETLRVLKADAILDGAPSALERIRMSQASSAATGAGLAATAAESGQAEDTCRVVSALPQQAVQLVPLAANSGLPRVAARPGDFLASARIPIGRTRFDADWARVSSKHLSVQAIERSMGAPDGDQLALIGQVNRWANRTIAYRADSPRIHGGDYWADARRTLRTQAGDCEDIAILKYQALLSLGISPGDMYFTLARDLARNADHALLVVRHQGRFYLLDDSTDALLDGSEANDYRPILSFGEGKWIHGLPAVGETAIYLSRNELSSPRVSGVVR